MILNLEMRSLTATGAFFLIVFLLHLINNIVFFPFSKCFLSFSKSQMHGNAPVLQLKQCTHVSILTWKSEKNISIKLYTVEVLYSRLYGTVYSDIL